MSGRGEVSGRVSEMNCAEFQKVLPYIIESGGNAEEEAHLSVCSVCSDLVRDLRYIAEQAKLLLPMHDPSPQVWDNIQGSLEREGLVKPDRARGRLLGSTGEVVRWITAGSAVVLIAAGLIFLRGTEHRSSTVTETAITTTDSNSSPQTAFDTQGDEQLLQAVAQSRPQIRQTYQNNLQQVNTYIKDAEENVRRDPGDEEAREHLADAYSQKAMLYEMATSSLP